MSIPGKSVGENGTTYEFEYMRKADTRTDWEKFRTGIWDPKERKFLGRTRNSWGGLLIFYAIFYAALAALFAICMYLWMATLSNREPKWQLHESRIGQNPGLGFRPLPRRTEEGSLIWYDAQNKTSVQIWTKILDKYLEAYIDQRKLPNGGKNQQICDFDKLPESGKVCAVDVSNFSECSPEHGYSFNRSSPCVFIKINRIFNWVPEYYNDPDNLPEEMPQELKDYITNLPAIQRNQVWISCQGQDPADRETIGNITYYPGPGFPAYYYPYRNLPGYLSPLVAIRLQRPALHVLINVECRAWAKNIEYHGGNLHREGSVHFEVMID